MPSEHDAQVAIFTWARMSETRLPALQLLFAVPNGARVSIGHARKLKAEGLKAGVPDICCRHHQESMPAW